MADDRRCFSKRPSAVLPDPTKVLANVSNGGSGRAIAEALFADRIDVAAAMLARDPRLLTTIVTHDPRMDAPPPGQAGDLLTIAVSRCDGDAIAMLLKAGMPPNGVKVGDALSLALLADTPAMAEQLLTAGASPDPQALPGGQDAMATAIAFSQIGAVMTLLRHGADPRWTDAFGVDRLRLAVDAEQMEIAELLVDKGASPWTVAEDGSMAVHELTAKPIVFDDAAMNAARARLVERARSGGLPWPPPDPATVTKMARSGQWPTAAMTRAGMTVSPQALARIQAR